MSLFLPYLFMTLAVLAISYGLGRVMLTNYTRAGFSEPYFGTFVALVVGLSTIVVSYAAVRTRGHTVLLPVLAIVLGLAWRLRSPSTPDAASNQPRIPVVLWQVLGVSVVVYAARFLLLYDPASPFLRTPFQDYIYYARISMPLNERGIESNSLEVIFSQFVGAQPYHYFELWLNALLTKLTALPALWCLYLSVYSVLVSIVVVGIRAVLAHFRVSGGWAWLLVALLLLASGVCWPLFARYPLTANGQLVASSLLLLEPKLAPVYLFLLLGVLLLLQRRFELMGLAVAALPLVYVSTGPAVAGGVAGLALYLAVTRQASRGTVLWLVAPLVLVVGYMGLFYALQPKSYQFSEPGGGTATELIPKVGEAGVLVNIFIGVFVNYALYFGAYLVVWAVVTRRWQLPKLNPFLVFAGTLVVSAAGMRTLATHYSDGFQFSSNVVAPLLPVVLAVVLGAAFATARIGQKLVAIALLVGLAMVNFYPLLRGTHGMHKTTRYSPGFLRQVQAVLPQLGRRGAFLLGDADYENTYMLSQDTYTAGTYVANFANNYALLSLSALSVDNLSTDPRYARDSVQSRQRLHTASLYRYARLVPQPRTTPDSLQYRFVTQNNVRFVCASARATLPATLRPLVRQVLADPLSGEKMYLLKTKSGQRPVTATPDQ